MMTLAFQSFCISLLSTWHHKYYPPCMKECLLLFLAKEKLTFCCCSQGHSAYSEHHWSLLSGLEGEAIPWAPSKQSPNELISLSMIQVSSEFLKGSSHQSCPRSYQNWSCSLALSLCEAQKGVVRCCTHLYTLSLINFIFLFLFINSNLLLPLQGSHWTPLCYNRLCYRSQSGRARIPFNTISNLLDHTESMVRQNT